MELIAVEQRLGMEWCTGKRAKVPKGQEKDSREKAREGKRGRNKRREQAEWILTAETHSCVSFQLCPLHSPTYTGGSVMHTPCNNRNEPCSSSCCCCYFPENGRPHRLLSLPLQCFCFPSSVQFISPVPAPFLCKRIRLKLSVKQTLVRCIRQGGVPPLRWCLKVRAVSKKL